MSEPYQVPKRQVQARLKLVGQAPADVALYLAERAQSHSGYECPSDLLNGGDEFIPTTDPQGRLHVLRRDAIIILSVGAALEENGGIEPEGVSDQLTTRTVELALEDGTRLVGDLFYWRPGGQRRLQDFLNTAERFVPLRADGMIHLVNRDRIVSLAELED